MLETKWQRDEDEGKGWSFEKTGNLFADQKTNLLKDKLISLISQNKEVNNGEVYEFTLRNGFLPKHTVEICNLLQDSRILAIVPVKNEKVRKGAFYVSYDNYKESPQKVLFKLI
ncbi:MAG TPA: hypothetical protein VGQ59_22110 [Cyclobacteriaceae bacterium]|jgi:hypothetical protein|nr:hypothetical protein [Cyclobacteriaceae bacterium]